MPKPDVKITLDQYEALLPVWAEWEIRSHTPTEDTYGYTCDERGCAICNLSDAAEYLDFAAAGGHLPDDNELIDAVVGWVTEYSDLAERLAFGAVRCAGSGCG